MITIHLSLCMHSQLRDCNAAIMSGANYCNRLLKKADNGTVFIYLFMFRTFYLKYQKKDAIISINQGHFQFIKFFE